tara:strand:+ start:457 stop:1035 length:579 start_codon:yes stop_codon:yes gene_type:complete
MNVQLPIILADFKEFALGFLLFFISLFMIFIILIQRGKGGGLAGALTGTAQSAFGAKAGDTMTRVTLVVSLIWILLISVTILAMNNTDNDAANELLNNDGSSRVNVSIESDDSSSDDSTSETSPLGGESSSTKIDLGLDSDQTEESATPDDLEEDTSPEGNDDSGEDTIEDTDASEEKTSDDESTEDESDNE